MCRVVPFGGYPSPVHSQKVFLKNLGVWQCLLHLKNSIMLSCTCSNAVAQYMCLCSLQWHASSPSVTWCWGLCAARHPKVGFAAVSYFRCKVRPIIACSAHLRHSDSAGGHVRYRFGGVGQRWLRSAQSTAWSNSEGLLSVTFWQIALWGLQCRQLGVSTLTLVTSRGNALSFRADGRSYTPFFKCRLQLSGNSFQKSLMQGAKPHPGL